MTRLSNHRFSTANTPEPEQIVETPTQQAHSFLLSLGYSNEVSNGIIDALLQNGVSHLSLLGMVKGLAGRYEVGEDGGLVALAASVQFELEKISGKNKITFWCLPSTGWSPASDNSTNEDQNCDQQQQQQQLPVIHSMDRAFVVETTVGTTLTDVAQFGTSENADVLGEYLDCACSGIMACSTCHVVIHPDWFDTAMTPSNGDSSKNKVGPPSEAEQDMIDLAYEPQLTSRLGCQIKLTEELDGLVILLPRGSNNLMDNIPFE
jgi:ferredoxin